MCYVQVFSIAYTLTLCADKEQLMEVPGGSYSGCDYLQSMH